MAAPVSYPEVIIEAGRARAVAPCQQWWDEIPAKQAKTTVGLPNMNKDDVDQHQKMWFVSNRERSTLPGAAVSPSDKNDHALVAQAKKSGPRRAAGAPRFTLPKPYRHRAAPDERPATSKSKLAMFALAALLFAGLIVELVALMQEHRRVRKLPVIAAMAPEPTPQPALLPAPPSAPVLAVAAAPSPTPETLNGADASGAGFDTDTVLAQAESPPREAVDAEPAGQPATIWEAAGTPVLSAPPKAGPIRAPIALGVTKTRRVRVPVKPATPVQDPDVVLVTAILMLTAKPEVPEQVTMCDPGSAKEATCSDAHSMAP